MAMISVPLFRAFDMEVATKMLICGIFSASGGCWIDLNLTHAVFLLVLYSLQSSFWASVHRPDSFLLPNQQKAKEVIDCWEWYISFPCSGQSTRVFFYLIKPQECHSIPRPLCYIVKATVLWMHSHLLQTKSFCFFLWMSLICDFVLFLITSWSAIPKWSVFFHVTHVSGLSDMISVDVLYLNLKTEHQTILKGLCLEESPISYALFMHWIWGTDSTLKILSNSQNGTSGQSLQNPICLYQKRSSLEHAANSEIPTMLRSFADMMWNSLLQLLG